MISIGSLRAHAVRICALEHELTELRARCEAAQADLLRQAEIDTPRTGTPRTAGPFIGADHTVDEVIAAHIVAVIQRVSNKERAAEILGIDRRTLYRWLEGTPYVRPRKGARKTVNHARLADPALRVETAPAQGGVGGGDPVEP